MDYSDSQLLINYSLLNNSKVTVLKDGRLVKDNEKLNVGDNNYELRVADEDRTYTYKLVVHRNSQANSIIMKISIFAFIVRLIIGYIVIVYYLTRKAKKSM